MLHCAPCWALDSVAHYLRQAPVKKAVIKKGAGPESDIGVTPPLGLFDPLGFLGRGPEAYRRYQALCE